ncbi:ComF family protein [Sulfobacillus acidophilus]|uniref:ComF family protein n=1 Tax=Sulfobacillus acidophilus TaxID=53633 RepID=A0ABS3AZ26_9FIRM|nr:ComF family protein [Sulfobacillus acidophilus]
MILTDLLNIFFPIRCIYCNKNSKKIPFCQKCLLKIEHIDERCLIQGSNRAAFFYSGLVREAILKAKFEPNESVARALSQLWSFYFCQNENMLFFLENKPACVSFVPLHWRRRVTRGFDFAAIIAKTIAKTLEIPLVDYLKCTRLDAPLSNSQNKEERLAKVFGKYTLRKKTTVKPHILLVDDIVTTGATFNAAREPLITAGANVTCYALAYTPLND